MSHACVGMLVTGVKLISMPTQAWDMAPGNHHADKQQLALGPLL